MAELTFLDRIEERPGAKELRAASYQLLGLDPGATCVDVGCGTGYAVGELAGSQVKAIGVDSDPLAVAAARERVPEAVFHLAPSDRLPLESGSVDGYRAARLFHLLEDPRSTVVEAKRVLRPGGRIVIVNQDHGFLMLASDDQDLTDVVLLGLESRSPSPRAARQTPDLLLDARFKDLTTTVHTDVVTDYKALAKQLEGAAQAAVDSALITQEDADSWLGEQARRGRRHRFLAILPTLLVTAVR